MPIEMTFNKGAFAAGSIASKLNEVSTTPLFAAVFAGLRKLTAEF
jgi:hypothetical protein